MHPRNKHNGRYNLKQLIKCCPELSPFTLINSYNDLSIDFFNPNAVMMLNKALLKYFYGINHWDVPADYLCPPIPGRADYIHHLADLLSSCNKGNIPQGEKIRCLDIGAGANCIYPILANCEYGWKCIGSEIDLVAVKSANKIIQMNPSLTGNIAIRKQNNPKRIFQGIIQANEQFDVTLCNPPFHASAADAAIGSTRKLNNLTKKKNHQPILNFGGQHNELWCVGGEKKFIHNMILESKQFAHSCFWFTTLVSKQTTLPSVYQALKQTHAVDVKTITMAQGNKISRFVAWTFLTAAEQEYWVKTRWK